MSNAKVFLVGGAVRDMLMGLTPKDFDFVVVGSSPEEMLSLGFEQVGADFPVFLHPVTQDEFALARTERKMGHGHTGFDCNWEGVTLEQDLARRDLTINAMAIPVGSLSLSQRDFDSLVKFRHNLSGVLKVGQLLTPVGKAMESHLKLSAHHALVDPFGGQADIEDKLLCCVSEHFAEDPLRVLRLGRFLARFGGGWKVDGDTMADCLTLVQEDKLEDLTPERVWKEVSRALCEPAPSAFFKFLSHLNWSGVKELTALKVVEQRPDFHPEGDAFVHTMLCVDVAARDGLSLEERFAVLLHDLGKRPAMEFNQALGKSHLGGHEGMGTQLVKDVCERWKVPTSCRKLALLVCLDHTNVHNLHRLKPNTIAKMFERWDLLRNEGVAVSVAHCAQADGRGRGKEFEDMEHPNFHRLMWMSTEWKKKVDVEELQTKSRKPLVGKAIGDAVRRVRVKRLAERKAWCDENMENNPR